MATLDELLAWAVFFYVGPGRVATEEDIAVVRKELERMLSRKGHCR